MEVRNAAGFVGVRDAGGCEVGGEHLGRALGDVEHGRIRVLVSNVLGEELGEVRPQRNRVVASMLRRTRRQADDRVRSELQVDDAKGSDLAGAKAGQRRERVGKRALRSRDTEPRLGRARSGDKPPQFGGSQHSPDAPAVRSHVAAADRAQRIERQ